MEDYAKYTLVFGLQCTLTALADLGVSSAVVNLVGTRGGDPKIVGSYIAAVRRFRKILLALVIPGGAVSFYYLALRQGWEFPEMSLLFALSVVSLFFQTSTSWYLAPLIIHNKLNERYRVNVGCSAGRLGAAAVAHIGNALNIGSLYVINALTQYLNCVFAKRASRQFFIEPDGVSPELLKEVGRYVGPQVPGIIFFALQGQITIFLISLFGATQSVAEIGALGRLGQIFMALSALSGSVIAPYFARLQNERVRITYFVTLGVSFLCVALVCLEVAIWPAPWQWLLGGKYSNLTTELIWSIGTSGVSFLGGLMHGIALARKWIFWWSSLLMIVAVLTVQTCMLATMPLGNTTQVLIFSFISTVVMVGVQGVIATRGLWQNKAAF